MTEKNSSSSAIEMHSTSVTCEEPVKTTVVSEEQVRRDTKSFWMLWTASGTNAFAYWAMQLALLLFAKHLTNSPLLIGGISFALNVSWLIFALPAGALVDRYDRRSMLVAITTLRLITFILAIIMSILGYISLPMLYSFALILGITQTLGEPALTAAVFMVVPQEKLDKANAWLAGAQNVIELLAFPLGGIFISISIYFSMNVGAVCSAAALLALLILKGSFHPSRIVKHRIMTEVLEGIRFLRNHLVLLVLGIMSGVINACWEGYLVIMVLYAVAPGPMGLTVTAYGILVMSGSVGSVAGTLLTAPVQRLLGRRWAIGLNIIGNSIMFAAPALTRNIWLIGATVVIGGMVSPMWTIAAASLQGRIVPTALQGRVNSVYRFLGIGLSAIGPIFIGLIAQIFGLRTAFLVCGCLTLLMIVPFFYVVTGKAMKQTHTAV